MDIKTCNNCFGTGEVKDYREFPFSPNGMEDYVTIEAQWIGRVNSLGTLGEIKDCGWCKGFGVTSVRQMSAYKTKALADRYRGTKAARTCHHCKGVTKVQDIPVWIDCNDCNGTGKLVVWDLSGDRLVPDFFDIYHYIDKEYCPQLADQLEIIVVRQDQGVSWIEANLGGGGCGSTIDYGRSWALPDQEVINNVREDLRKGFGQAVNWVDKETRIMTNRLAIRLRQNGYTKFPLFGDSVRPTNMASLPPTYAGLDKVEW